ncbi:uncharacterized protein LOC143429082 [Xylocopa sonorina]|uniref:uncharacterized protein LOC143429082 n=1 Tax=Xylocopa sonorina TaxID=1818115 RepID=UPI00403ACF4F
MVGRYRERQYQRAAQKHNEEFLRYDYYQQIARYFERECQIAKHYDSWNYKSPDPKGEIEKAKKAERLQARRNKLRNLLKEEDETYRKELEERKKVKNRRTEPPLEVWWQKSREERPEQSIYLPRACRRYQSYFVYPKESNSQRWNTLRDTNLQYSRVCKDTTNFIQQNGQNFYRRSSKMSEDSGKSVQEQQNVAKSQDSPNYSSHQYSSDSGVPSSRYSARYARRSLENTNVRYDDSGDPPSSPQSGSPDSDSPTEKVPLSNEEIPLSEDDKENKTRDTKLNSPQTDTLIERRTSSSMEDIKKDELDYAKQSSIDHLEGNVDTGRSESSMSEQRAKEYQVTTKNDTRQFEIEKSMPWLRMIPGDKNLSKQMFLYLTHKELKRKIEDLARRELHACNKQSWDEALRLRDMRNKVELIREKELYNTENLDLDEESRKLGFINIYKREAELNEREKACMDMTMYSEDAKAMWKKWVYEDERSVTKDARQQREKLMNSLEKEWQNLAIRDKEKIAQSYQSVMADSALQEEHKLAPAINAARMKSVSSSWK